MQHRTTTVTLIGLLTLGGCATGSGREPTDASADRTAVHDHRGSGRAEMIGQRDNAEMCPMNVRDTTVQAAHVASGAALAFTTKGDVTELQRRVTRMAEMHNNHHAADSRQPMMRGKDGQRQGTSMPGMTMIHTAQARVEEIPGGARIVFTPRETAQLGGLRQHVGRMAERMGSRECPMMSTFADEDGVAREPAEHDKHHR